MIDIYVGKGVSCKDAETVLGLRTTNKHKEFFINHMMVCAASVLAHSHSLSVPCVCCSDPGSGASAWRPVGQGRRGDSDLVPVLWLRAALRRV